MRFDKRFIWHRRISKRDISYYCYDPFGNVSGRYYRTSHYWRLEILEMLRIHRLFLGKDHPCVGCKEVQYIHLNKKRAITARRTITRNSPACCMNPIRKSFICRKWTEKQECYHEHHLGLKVDGRIYRSILKGVGV